MAVVILLGICLIANEKVSITFANPKLNNLSEKIVNNSDIAKEKIIEVDYLAEELENISKIIRNVSNSHEYRRGIWDCTDYSREDVRQLKEAGYNATCIFGIYYNRYFINNDTYKDSYAHNWVDVYLDNETIHLEVTNGMNVGIIEDYEANYLPRVYGKCI